LFFDDFQGKLTLLLMNFFVSFFFFRKTIAKKMYSFFYLISSLGLIKNACKNALMTCLCKTM